MSDLGFYYLCLNWNGQNDLKDFENDEEVNNGNGSDL